MHVWFVILFILYHFRACRGRLVTLFIRFPNQGRQVEDLDIWSHTNDTLGSVRRQILNRVKVSSSSIKVDLYVNGELLDPSEDKKLISQIPLRDRTVSFHFFFSYVILYFTCKIKIFILFYISYVK